jgi:hypothetical protein
MVKAGYTGFDIALYPDPGKDVDVSSDNSSMTVGSSLDTAHARAPAVVAASVEAGKRVTQPQTRQRVRVQLEETIGSPAADTIRPLGRGIRAVYTRALELGWKQVIRATRRRPTRQEPTRDTRSAILSIRLRRPSSLTDHADLGSLSPAPERSVV